MVNARIPRRLREQLLEVSRRMRTRPTLAESRLWHHLRHWQIGGYKFRRQHIINRFIVDFYCAEAKLVVEVDGEIHIKQKALDKDHDAILQDLGHTVMRFTNQQVLIDIANVLNQIHLVCLEASTNRNIQPPFPLKGEG